MADNKRVDQIMFQFDTDKASIAKTEAAFGKLRGKVVSDIQKFEKELQQSASLTNKLSQEVNKLANQKAIDKLTKDVTKAKEGTDKWKKALQELEAQLKKVGATEDQIQGVAGNIANAGSGRKRIAAGVGAAAISIRNQAAIQTPLGISTDAIAKMVALLANLSPVAVPFLAVLGGIAAVFVGLEITLADSKKALNEATAANKAYFELLGDGSTTDDAKKKLQELNAEIANNAAELATIENAFASGFKGAQSQFGDAGAKVLTFVGQLTTTDDKLAGRADELRSSLADQEATAARLRAELEKGSFTINDVIKAEEELTKQRETSAKALEQLADQRNDLLQREGQQVAQLTEDRIVADLRELADWNAQREDQLEAHVDNIAGIDEQGQERLAQIHASGIDKIASIDKRIGDLYDDLAGLESDGADKREKVNRDYMREEITELEKFRKDESGRTRDYYKDRERLLQDLNDTLLDAEQENDVVAFVAAQKAAEKELRRNQEDFDLETQDRQSDYLAQRAVEQQQLQEKLADIQTEADVRRAEIQERIAEQQAAKAQVILDIQDQLAAERARILQSKIDAQAAFDEARKRDEEAFAKRQQREAEDEARSDLRRTNALNTQLADIKIKEAAEQAAITSLLVKVNQLKAVIATMNVGGGSSTAGGQGGASFSGNGTGTNASYTNPGGGGKFNPFAFAGGGIATQPTYGVFGERPGYNEALVPFRKSEGIENAIQRLGLGGESVVINLNGDIGSLTRSELTAELTKLGETIVKAKWQARTGAVAA